MKYAGNKNNARIVTLSDFGTKTQKKMNVKLKTVVSLLRTIHTLQIVRLLKATNSISSLLISSKLGRIKIFEVLYRMILAVRNYSCTPFLSAHTFIEGGVSFRGTFRQGISCPELLIKASCGEAPPPWFKPSFPL